MLSFVVWTLWATIAAKLNMVGFHFTDEQLFTLAALPGLVGATGRLFYTYLPGLMGGRNSAFITTALLLLPLFGLGRALQDPTTSYDTFVLLVSFIGIAGANFSASMANIGFFFPKAHKGLALGINAGVGNLGVSLIYLTAPLLLGWNLSSFFGPGVETPNGMMYVQNVCYFWTVPTALTLVLIWMFMDNLPLPKQSPKSMLSIFGNKHTWLMCWIYTCGFGSFIGFSAALGLLVSKEFPEVSFSMAAFLGPFIGAGIRPVGGWLADRLDSGSKVTLLSLFIMLAASIVDGLHQRRFVPHDPLHLRQPVPRFARHGLHGSDCRLRRIPDPEDLRLVVRQLPERRPGLLHPHRLHGADDHHHVVLLREKRLRHQVLMHLPPNRDQAAFHGRPDFSHSHPCFCGTMQEKEKREER